MNGRLPNQDLVNSVAHISKWAGGVPTRYHNIPESPVSLSEWWDQLPYIQPHLGNYLLAAKHLWQHGKYMALGRASGSHGVLAR